HQVWRSPNEEKVVSACFYQGSQNFVRSVVTHLPDLRQTGNKEIFLEREPDRGNPFFPYTSIQYCELNVARYMLFYTRSAHPNDLVAKSLGYAETAPASETFILSGTSHGIFFVVPLK